MKNGKYIQRITTLGLIVIFTLQAIWLYNTYALIENDIYKECNAILDNSLRKEINLISKNIPEGTVIMGGVTNDSITVSTYLYDGLSKLGIQYSINEIDSIVGSCLKSENINANFVIYNLSPKTKEIYKTSKEQPIPQWGAIKSEIIPIRLDMSQGMQLVLRNPYLIVFERMGLLMIATAFMVVFVVGCIVYQIKIISRMRRISQIREDFSYAMIHDMKTPLSTIMMGLNFLHNPKIDEKPELKSKYFNMAESETAHLLKLTNKVLAMAKLESHKLEMTKKEVPLTPMLQQLSEKFIAKSSKPVHITTDLHVEKVLADEEYLKEVFDNLIDNAIKYSKESVEIKISSLNNEQYTIIKVYDNGLGIPEKDQCTVFNKYERSKAAKRSRKGGAPGFGLGLNFVSQVIEAHDGRVLVNSIEGEFSEFIIYLPKIM